MIDISSVKGTAVYFVLLELIRTLEQMQKRIDELEASKQDRKGRKAQ